MRVSTNNEQSVVKTSTHRNRRVGRRLASVNVRRKGKLAESCVIPAEACNALDCMYLTANKNNGKSVTPAVRIFQRSIKFPVIFNFSDSHPRKPPKHESGNDKQIEI